MAIQTITLDDVNSANFMADFNGLLFSIKTECAKKSNSLTIFHEIREKVYHIVEDFYIKLDQLQIHCLFAAFADDSTIHQIDIFNKLQITNKDNLVENANQPIYFNKVLRSANETYQLLLDCKGFLSYYYQVFLF